MTTALLLDTSILGMITNPKASAETRECYSWFEVHWSRGIRIVIPEIADYELRRELLRISATGSMARLDALKAELEYAPITTPAMMRAARYWAQARRQGRPTAADEALDCDVILAAQATLMQDGQDDCLIATTNVKHLDMFVAARAWREIDLG